MLFCFFGIVPEIRGMGFLFFFFQFDTLGIDVKDTS